MEVAAKHRHLILVVGHAGTGKDTAASYLAEKYGFKTLSGYEPLKRMCSLAGLPEDRGTLTVMGHAVSSAFGRDIFVKWCDRRLGRSSVTLKDFRFLNEIRHYRSKACAIVMLRCSMNVAYARMVSRGRAGDPNSLSQLRQVWKDEGELDSVPKAWTKTIDNEGNIHDFYSNLDRLVLNLP
ncbi:MAG: hypothetical protein QW767_04850 [Thermoprotei archaeon]